MNDEARKRIEEKIALRHLLRAAFLDRTDKLTTESAKAMRALRSFCYAGRTTARINQTSGAIDPVAMGINEGMRLVFLMVEQTLDTDDVTFQRQLDSYQQQENDND